MTPWREFPGTQTKSLHRKGDNLTTGVGVTCRGGHEASVALLKISHGLPCLSLKQCARWTIYLHLKMATEQIVMSPNKGGDYSPTVWAAEYQPWHITLGTFSIFCLRNLTFKLSWCKIYMYWKPPWTSGISIPHYFSWTLTHQVPTSLRCSVHSKPKPPPPTSLYVLPMSKA